MIYIYYGDDRVKAQKEIKKLFGDDYEVMDGEELTKNDLPDIFFGMSIFGERKIVVKNLSMNKNVFAELEEYLDTKHEVVLWEEKLDKRMAIIKRLAKDQRVSIKEFKITQVVDRKIIFEIYDTALKDGEKAVKMLEEIREEQEPFMFFGLLVSQAVKKYEWRHGAKEKRVLLELSKLDMQMKGDSGVSTTWPLIQSFLLRVSSL